MFFCLQNSTLLSPATCYVGVKGVKVVLQDHVNQ